MPTIRFRLNGAPTEVDADPDGSLLDLLRGRLGLTGAHSVAAPASAGPATSWSAIAR